jgi:hypothetical protein
MNYYRPSAFEIQDIMTVEFLDNRLAEVSAYRLYHNLGNKRTTGALTLRWVEDGHGGLMVDRDVGPAFTDIFHCESGFSIELARAQFGG